MGHEEELIHSTWKPVVSKHKVFLCQKLNSKFKKEVSRILKLCLKCIPSSILQYTISSQDPAPKMASKP